MNSYPVSYFTSLFPARRIFAERKSTFWQKLVTTIFLIALLIIPVSLQVARLEAYPLDQIVDGIFEPLTDEVLADFSTATISDGAFHYTGVNYEQVYAGDTAQDVSGFSYQFATDKLIIRRGQDILAELSYQQMTSADFASRDSLTAAISQAWFQENRVLASLLLLSVSGLLLATNFLLVCLGASFILFLISRTSYFSFGKFGESYQFVLNAMGLPSILACIVGLFQQPIQNVILAQNMLFALVLVWVFFKTRFQDEKE